TRRARQARLCRQALAQGLSTADLLLDFRLRRERPLRAAQGLRSSHPGRIRAFVGDGRPRGARPCRRLGRRYRGRASAYEAVLEALLQRARTGDGADISISMFDAMAEWMTVPLLNQEGGNPFKRIGLAHPTIAPYGVFKSRDGADILISIQNDREWRVLADKVLGDASLGANEKFAKGPARLKHRGETDAIVAAAFAKVDVEALMKRLGEADIAFARVNDSALLTRHPHLRRIAFGAPTGEVSVPATPARWAGLERRYGAIPALGEHSDKIRREFGGK